jgi:hypothetical protein
MMSVFISVEELPPLGIIRFHVDETVDIMVAAGGINLYMQS